MVKRLRNANLGDVFEVKLKNNSKAYFQYIGLDKSQLNSEVIRVFEPHFDCKKEVEICDIVQFKVDFYVHVIIKNGEKRRFWKKIGNMPLEIDFSAPYFRESPDFGNPDVKISSCWHIWKMNNEYDIVVRLNDEQKKYNYGGVFPPFLVVEQIENNGKYPYSYPSSK